MITSKNEKPQRPGCVETFDGVGLFHLHHDAGVSQRRGLRALITNQEVCSFNTLQCGRRCSTTEQKRIYSFPAYRTGVLCRIGNTIAHCKESWLSIPGGALRKTCPHQIYAPRTNPESIGSVMNVMNVMSVTGVTYSNENHDHHVHHDDHDDHDPLTR